MAEYKLKCCSCGKIQATGYAPFCETCGQLTDVEFDLANARLHDSDNPFERFYDLIPVKDHGLLPSDDRFTDTVHAKTLGKRLGLANLYLKNETQHPTGTTKYRMAAVALPYLYENGVRHFCSSSTGNSSTAYAQLIANIPALKMSLFTGSEFASRVNFADTEQVDHYVLEDGTFVEAFGCAAEFAKQHGYTSERGFFNPGRREGLKLAFFEACDIIPQPVDWYVQAVSSAMGVYGTYKGARELISIGAISRLPRLLCVQQETCSPLVRAWQEGAEKIEERHIFRHPTGIAMAILRGNPSRVYPYMRAVVKESHGDFVAVSEHSIRQARKLVMQDEGIDICFSSAAAVAGLIDSIRDGRVPGTDTILVNLTGSDRSPDVVSSVAGRLQKIDEQWQLI